MVEYPCVEIYTPIQEWVISEQFVKALAALSQLANVFRINLFEYGDHYLNGKVGELHHHVRGRKRKSKADGLRLLPEG